MNMFDILNDFDNELNKNFKEKTNKSAIDVLAEIEKMSYVCGDLMCLPKKEFYKLVKRTHA